MDSALGAALTIPQSALDKIKEADDKLIKIQQTAKDTASSVKASFGTMEGSAKGFIGALDQIITKLGYIDTKAKGMSGSLNNLGATKAAQEVTQMNGAIVQAAENIERVAASQKKATSSNDFAKSVADWQNLQTQIDATNNRQQELTASMRQYEMEQQRIRSGKGGIISRDDQANYAASQKEFEANKNIIATLREKQQQIVNNNQALSQQISLVKSLRDYGQDSGFADKKYKAEMQQLKEAIQLRAKKAAESQKQSEKEQKEADKEAKATEKAEERKRAAWAKSTAAYGQQYHNERQAMYNQLFSTSNTNVSTAIANSQSASTLRDHVAAIKELQQARLNLVTTDKNYKQNLATINEAIKQHSKVLKDAGLNARNLGEQYSYLSGYISRLAQRTAVVFSMTAAKSFVENIAEVRGQFELSERSLEAILQNKPKADEIFNKTVELAVKSPFRIKDLVDYTRQLSAYRIESDKLYDTTKRLADVSAGLGVDMGRLILAYGQVKAAAYLRGSEVRQFTEAGINMYGELQQYFKEVKGEAYTTAQIVDMISKRKVTFEDVEAIFQRMTDKGGTFYNMQEIQAETLQGKISNLHDAFDVMLNDIGTAHQDTFKGLISDATSLLEHWEAIANAGKVLASVLLLLYVRCLQTKTAFKDIFAKSFATQAAESKGLIASLNSGLINAGNAAKQFGKNLGNAIKANAWIIALMAIFSVIRTINEADEKYHEDLMKITDDYDAQVVQIQKITNQYNALKKARENATTSNNRSFDFAGNERSQKAQLQSLYSMLNKYKLQIPVEIGKVDMKNIDDAIKKAKDELMDFEQTVADIKEHIAKDDDKWYKNGWLGIAPDSFSENYKDLKNAENDLRTFSSSASAAIDLLNTRYSSLSSESKKYFDQVKDGAREGETQANYLIRVNAALREIEKSQQKGTAGWQALQDAEQRFVRGGSSGFERYLAEYNEALRRYKSDMDGLVNDIADKNGARLREVAKDPIRFRTYVDQLGLQAGLDEANRFILYNEMRHKFNVKFAVDEKSMNNTQKKVYSFIDDLQAAADARGIKLSLDVLNPTEALKTVQGYQQSMQNIKATIEQIQRSQANYYHGSAIGITDKKWFKGLGKNVNGDTVFTKKRALEFLKEQLAKSTYDNWFAGGADPFAKDKGKTNTNTDKTVNDIFQQKINLLKEMNEKYEELQEHMNDEAALREVRKYYSDAAANVGWNADDIVPDAQSVIAKLKELAKQTSDISKRGNILRIAADIQAKWDKKYNEQQLEEAKKDVEDAFSKLDLFKKLTESGLNKEQISSMFGDMVTSFEDVRKRITDTFEAKYGKDHNSEKWGDKETKEYTDAINKLDEKIQQDQVSQAQELIKAYKQRLTEQLQLDKWYYSERMKIQENENLKKDPDLQKQLTDNLTSDYRKKQADLDWKEFQNSDTYISIFENLDHTSGKVLDYMIDKLKNVREQLKGLDPTQVKAVTEQIQKLEETKNARNPFKSLISGYKEMIKAHKEYKKLGGDKAWANINKQNDAEKKDIKASDERVAQLEAEYNQSLKNTELTEEQRNNLKTNLGFEKAINAQKKAQNKKTQESVDELNNARGASEKAENKFSTSVTSITDMVSAMGTAFGSLAQNLGFADDTLTNSVNFLDHAGQAIGSIYSKNWAGVVSNAVGAIGDVINLFSSESKIDKEIERQERAVSRLQYAYENLKQSMDDAFDIGRLQEYHNKSVETLEDEKKAYEAMISAEQGRKNPDDSKIQQWQQEIQTLDKTIKELGESLTESLGGFGSDANYKSAAQEFADAWVDAFNDGSDALDALNDKFDDYFNTLLKKQLMYRASQKYIEPILKAFDDAVAEGSAGGNNGYEVTKEELENIQKLKDTNLKAFNDYAESLMKVLGVTPSGSSTLSNLQQGIQSVTETTAQALESILNSMRFYVAQEQSDVAAIRLILEQRLGAVTTQAVDGGASNQMIALMEQQAGYLKQICDNWGYVMKSGHSQGGKGLKVFMN